MVSLFLPQASQVYATIVNEYNEPYQKGRYPDMRMIRDQTIEILSDAQNVAPVVNMGNLHSDVNHNSYFYVFNYRTQNGDYSNASDSQELLTGGNDHHSISKIFLKNLHNI